MKFLVVQATHVDSGHIHLEKIFEEEVPSTSPAVDKKQATRTTKVRTLFLAAFIYQILSSMSRSSFSLFYASCFLWRVPPLTKHLCITKRKLRPYSISCVLYQSHPIYLPALTLNLKLGMTTALFRWAYVLCCFAGFFKLILRSGPFQKINVLYIYYIYICIYAPPHTTFLFLFITFEFHLKWYSASSSPHRGRCSRLQTFKSFNRRCRKSALWSRQAFQEVCISRVPYPIRWLANLDPIFRTQLSRHTN